MLYIIHVFFLGKHTRNIIYITVSCKMFTTRKTDYKKKKIYNVLSIILSVHLKCQAYILNIKYSPCMYVFVSMHK